MITEKFDTKESTLAVDINEATQAVKDNRFKDALNLLEITLVDHPEHIDSLYLAGVCSRYLKNFDESKKYIESLLIVAPDMALKVIDRALDRVHMERAKFGAVMSRMNVVIDNLTNVSTNQKTSMSRITDANFAAESARLAKSQILQQSGMNMISQASRTMQNVLILFN